MHNSKKLKINTTDSWSARLYPTIHHNFYIIIIIIMSSAKNATVNADGDNFEFDGQSYCVVIEPTKEEVIKELESPKYGKVDEKKAKLELLANIRHYKLHRKWKTRNGTDRRRTIV